MTRNCTIIVLAVLLLSSVFYAWRQNGILAIYKEASRVNIKQQRDEDISYRECVKRVRKCEPIWGIGDNDIYCRAADSRCFLIGPKADWKEVEPKLEER